MSELLRVHHGYTLDEIAPTVYTHSQTDSTTSLSKTVFNPIKYLLGSGWLGYFATLSSSTGKWVQGRDFAYDGLAYNSYSDTATQARFWSWTDSAYHTITLREISQDPDNPRIRTYDIQDSILGQIKSAFTVDTGYYGNYNFPELGFSVDYVMFRGANATRTDYIAHNVDVLLGYYTDLIDHTWYSEVSHTFTGIDASVFPNPITQTDITHTITETITTS